MNCWLCQGYRTGHIYRDAATSQRYGRAGSEANIAAGRMTPANDIAALLYAYNSHSHSYTCFMQNV